MPKRKRSEEGSENGPSADTSANRRQKLCAQRIESAKKALIPALRLGAGFERQKYSRRRKTANQKSDEKAITRLDAEYAALKSMEFTKVAEQHLRKTITKVKSIASNDGIPERWREAEKEKSDQVTLNVMARLFKMAGVKKVIDEAIDDLKDILDVGAPKAEKASKGNDVKAQSRLRRRQEVELADADEDSDNDEGFEGFNARIAAPSSAEEDSDDSLSEGLRPSSIEDSDDERDYEDLRSEESGGESDAIQRTRYESHESGNEALGSTETSGNDESEDENERKIKRANATPKARAVEKASRSTFLPSLSMANYFSGSESEASDLDDDRPRKNRRGQKARQAIWEKKYGAKAKHLAKQDRKKGWDPKRGAVDGAISARGERGVRGRKVEKTGANTVEISQERPRKAARKDDSGPLHPSWQAAKLAKEKKMDAKPQGKKVVFD